MRLEIPDHLLPRSAVVDVDVSEGVVAVDKIDRQTRLVPGSDLLAQRIDFVVRFGGSELDDKSAGF